MAVTEEPEESSMSGATVSTVSVSITTYILRYGHVPMSSSEDFYDREVGARIKARKVTGNTQRIPFYRGLTKTPCHGSARRLSR